MSVGEQTRRDFFANTCRLASVAALSGVVASALESCGGSSPASPGGTAASLPIVNGAASGSTITLTVTGTALATTGAMALVRTSSGDVLVARTAGDTFVALSAACTHQNCEVTAFADQTYICTCHGSEFNTSGQVVRGPAATSLRKYTTQFANDILTITA